jgi:PST family polysaccharide transporter
MASRLSPTAAAAGRARQQGIGASSGPAKGGTYREILRSTAVIAGSTAVNIGIGIVRTKVMAVLLGPAGLGLMGTFTSIADLVRTAAQMGVNNSGVRQIAESVGSGDTDRIARTVAVLRRITLALGMVGALSVVLFARQISVLTFGSDQHATAVSLLSVAVFLRMIADSQGALLQGMRRIGDLARIGVLGALLGTVSSIPLVYYFRQDGVVPSLIAVAAWAALTSAWYSRKVRLEPVAMTPAFMRAETLALLRLGLAFMASGFLTMGAAYVVRLILIRQEGLQAAGLYQAAWTLAGLYVGFVLQAMGTDFYPRLVAAAKDNLQCNRLVNEQAHVSLLLAGTGVLATVTFAPPVLTLFYSTEFQAATEVLRWTCLGMALRVVTWPLGYILIAKGEQTLFFCADLAWTIVNVGLSWLCVQWFGLEGAGIAFLASYVSHLLIVYPISRRLSGFRWSGSTFRTGLRFVVAIVAVQMGFRVFGLPAAMALGSAATLVSAIGSVHALRGLVSQDRAGGRLARLLQPKRRQV